MKKDILAIVLILAVAAILITMIICGYGEHAMWAIVMICVAIVIVVVIKSFFG